MTADTLMLPGAIVHQLGDALDTLPQPTTATTED